MVAELPEEKRRTRRSVTMPPAGVLAVSGPLGDALRVCEGRIYAGGQRILGQDRGMGRVPLGAEAERLLRNLRVSRWLLFATCYKIRCDIEGVKTPGARLLLPETY